MKVFALLLLLSVPAFAQRSLSEPTFLANVKPVLTGILSDFYQMVGLFPDFPRELVLIIDDVDELHSEKNLLREKCPRELGASCLENIDRLRRQLQTIDFRIYELLLRQRSLGTLYLNREAGLRVMSDVQQKTLDLKSILDNSSFLIKAQISSKRLSFEIIKNVDELSALLSLAVIEYVPFLYRKEFEQFYVNFVHRCQQQISKHTGWEFVNQNIRDLNFHVNLLNQSLTKRSKKTPEGMAPYLSTIHNRWNSILRYYY